MSRDGVVVIGAGVIGLSIAVHLRLADIDVLVLDADAVGSGSSGGNAGWIVPALSAPVAAPGAIGYGLRNLLKPSGGFAIRPVPTPQTIEWTARFAAATSRKAFDAGLAATAAFAADAADSFAELTALGLATPIHTRGMLIVHADASAAEAELREYMRLREFGIEVAEDVLDPAALTAREPALGRDSRAGILFPAQQFVDPLALTCDLAALARRLGAEVREHTPVARLSAPADPRIHLASGETLDATVVIAAGDRSTTLAASLGYRLPMQSGKGYSVSVQPAHPLSTPVYLPRAKAALTPLDERLRIAGVMELGGSGRSVNTARLSAMQRSSERFLAQDFVTTDPRKSDAWSGLRPVTADGLPVIGRVPGSNRAFIASGHAMLGVTLGPLTGKAITDLVVGRRPTGIEPFRPDRFLWRRQPQSRREQ